MKTREDFTDILQHVTYKDWLFDVVGLAMPDLGPWALRVRFFADGEWQTGRKWYLSPHSTKSEVVLTAAKAVITAEEHEARENFRYRGKRVVGPHIDVDFLATHVGQKENLDVREMV